MKRIAKQPFMQLKIYSLKGAEFDGEAEAFSVMTASGEITVLDHHQPLVTILRPCAAKIRRKNGTVETHKVRSGFLEMDEYNNLSVLLD